jgi:hypothetical protein
MDTPVIRDTERMDDPSQSIERTWIRVDIGSLFMPSMI